VLSGGCGGSIWTATGCRLNSDATINPDVQRSIELETFAFINRRDAYVSKSVDLNVTKILKDNSGNVRKVTINYSCAEGVTPITP